MPTLIASAKRTSLVSTLGLAFLLLSGCVNRNPDLFDISCTLDDVVVLEAVGFTWGIDDGILWLREGSSRADSKIRYHRMAPKENCSMTEIVPPEEKRR